MNKSFNTTTPKIIGGITIGLICIIALYLFVVRPISDENSQQQTANVTNTTDANDSDATNQSPSNTTTNNRQNNNSSNSTTYKNGTYSAAQSYRVPGGTNRTNLTITVKNDVITNLDNTNTYDDQKSAFYIEEFEDAIQSEVVDIDISSISLNRVGGASLTTAAFSEALQTALNEAR